MMSVPSFIYPRTTYSTTFPVQAPILGSVQPYISMAHPVAGTIIDTHNSPATPSPFGQYRSGFVTALPPKLFPSLPNTPSEFKSLAKAVGFLLPAILLARMKPSAIVANEKFLPSDWKVWAKMGFSMACLSELHKAMDWDPPPWLRAFLNVCMMTSLMPSLAGTRLKVILGVGSTVAALAQLSQYAFDKLKAPLQQKYNIPPWATQLGLAVINMGFGVVAMPTLMRPLFPAQRETSVLYTTCPNACCSSPFCINTAFSNLTLAEQGIRSEIQQHQHAHKDGRS